MTAAIRHLWPEPRRTTLATDVHWTAGAFATVVIGLAVAGCSWEGFTVGDVTGTVTLGERPLPGVMVQFQPQTEKLGARPTAYGFTDADGRYRLVRAGGKPGAVVGTHDVRILPQERDGQPATPLPNGLGGRVFEFRVRPGKNVIDIRVDPKTSS